MAEKSTYENRETVMARGGFQPEPRAGYSNDIFGMLISVGLIFGGLSGRMVLRGTDSSPALVVAGFAFLVWDIISMIRKKSTLQKAEEERYARNSRMYELEKKAGQDERSLSQQTAVRIACDKGLAALDFGPRLNGSTMTRNAAAREYTGSTDRIHNIVSFSNLDLTVVFDADPAASEIVLDLFRDKTGIGLALPENVTHLQEEPD